MNGSQAQVWRLVHTRCVWSRIKILYIPRAEGIGRIRPTGPLIWSPPLHHPMATAGTCPSGGVASHTTQHSRSGLPPPALSPRSSRPFDG